MQTLANVWLRLDDMNFYTERNNIFANRVIPRLSKLSKQSDPSEALITTKLHED
jgi:hypothetical protein